jgi:large subunit ribosomal protein L15
MSLLGSLMPKRGARHRRKLLGRGIGSGKGGTAGKGHKGQKARSGGKIIRGFEGGQMPMARRMPKFGFKNTAFRTPMDVVNLSQLEGMKGEVTPETLAQAGLVRKNVLVKVLGKGTLKSVVTVKAHKFSETAKTGIESAGGKVEVI